MSDINVSNPDLLKALVASTKQTKKKTPSPVNAHTSESGVGTNDGTAWSPPKDYSDVTRRWHAKHAKDFGTPNAMTHHQAHERDRYWRSLGKRIASGARISDGMLKGARP